MKEIDVTQQFSGSGRHSHSGDTSKSIDGRVIHAVKSYMELIEQGSPPDRKAFIANYPEIAESLEPYLDALLMVENRIAKDIRGLPASFQNTQLSSDVSGVDTALSLADSNLGDFKILKELGRGGMGIVYEAFQISLGRRVALKVLSLAGGLDPIRLQRFRNEAQAAAQLHHTHIVPVYAVGSDRGVHYYAMQLIEGKSLAHTIERVIEQRSSANNAPKQSNLKNTHAKSTNTQTGDSATAPASNSNGQSSSSTRKKRDTPKVSPSSNTVDQLSLESTLASNNRSERVRYFRNVARMMHQAALALEHAHQYGVVHRDIKPANLMLDPLGNIWITDFGLAQIQSDSNLTQTGDIIGTLRYMSPEQASGGSIVIDHRTDVYSLGITFYELMTLQAAVKAGDYQNALRQVLEVDPPSPRSIDSSIPVELETIVQKSIAKVPSERYATAQQLADDIERWMDDKPILAKPPTFLQLASKWRRRHAGIVNAAMVFVCFALVGLAITTWTVIREQGKTAVALAKQVEQSRVAEMSFQQARRAVDTFTQLSELELANRGDLRSLRRDFLETSLDFYRDFLTTRSGDASVAKELAATSTKVTKMIEDLAVLDNLGPLQWLSIAKVQKDLKLSAEQIKKITPIVKELFASDSTQQNLSDNPEQMSEVTQKVDAIHSLLEKSQLERLRQIDRQSRLPFTFKSHDVVAKLHLTSAQKREIASIIEQERPDALMHRERPNGPMGGGLGGRPLSPDGFGPPPHPNEKISADGSSPMRQKLMNELNREESSPPPPRPNREAGPRPEAPPDDPFGPPNVESPFDDFGPPDGPEFRGGPGRGPGRGPGFGGIPGFGGLVGGPRERGGPGGRAGGLGAGGQGFGGPGFEGQGERGPQDMSRGNLRPGDPGYGPPDREGPPEHGDEGGPLGLLPMFSEMFRPGGGPGRNRMDAFVAAQTAKTVARIVEILSEDQKKAWAEMIGEPFFAERM